MITTSPTGTRQTPRAYDRPRGDDGFSLIELLVVFVLIALSLSVAGPAIGGALDTSRLQASVRAVAATARQARSLARQEQREVVLVIDVLEHTYRLDDRREHKMLPASIEVEVLGAESERLSESRIGIRFFADGSATGGRIRLSLAGQRHFIEVDWLTGLAQIAQ